MPMRRHRRRSGNVTLAWLGRPARALRRNRSARELGRDVQATEMAYEQHIQSAQSQVARCVILTLSDTRTEANDTSGRGIRQLLESQGHIVVHYAILQDDSATLDAKMLELLGRPEGHVIPANGGAGISRRDVTLGVIERHLGRPLPAFGGLFRMLSWEQIGSGAMLSRAVGGIARGQHIVFAMPGSTKAVELAMTRLILPELKHLLGELNKVALGSGQSEVEAREWRPYL